MPWQDMGDDPCPPRRKPKDFGKGIRKINVTTNHFEVTVKNPTKNVIHYDVDIKSGDNMAVRLPKKLRMMIFQKMRESFPKVFGNHVLGFDSEKSAYSLTPLFQESKTKPDRKFEVEIHEFGRSQKFIVTLKSVNCENLSTLMNALKAGNEKIPQTIIQMLEVIFQHNLCLQYEKIGRNKFFSTGRDFGTPFGIGGGKEVLGGFFGSLRPVGWKDNTMLLNVDVVNAAFYKEQSVIEFIKELLDISDRELYQPLSPYHKRKITSSLKKMKVRVTHSNIPRTYKVVEIGDLGADKQTFLHEDKKCTVQQYFTQKYHIQLRFPKLNLLQVAPENKKIYLPIECCKIAKGQKVQGKLSDNEAAQFIRKTAKLPRERLQNITHMVKELKFSSDPNIRGLEFSISERPMAVEGHILQAPQLRMNKEFPPVKGVWDIRDKIYFSAAALQCWVVLNYSIRFIRSDTLMQFINNMKKMGKERGMNINDPALIFDARNPAPETDLLNVKKRYPDVQLIVVVLPKDGDYYARIKKIGDREISVVTQCVRDSNVNKNGPQIVGNLLLKINAKIGGVNNVLGQHGLVVFNTPVIIMGADVNHPPAHDKITPSLAAVVASMNRHASTYATEVRHQKHRTEMIQEMKAMTKNLLLTFYRINKRKPERIVMFRDGVSESQFLEVLSFELKAMRAACTELEKTYEPSMTFIVVQKRHHTRLFCSERDGVGKSGNVPPGTTVDNTITHPTQRDFYLCSHQGIIGTSRPTHYHVLWDDSDLSMEMLQNLTYAMCHLYSRCTRSVSIPTPAYYAHLVAFRAKLHIRDLCPSETASLSSGEEQSVPSDAVMTQAAKVDIHDKIATHLYFV
ncbi:protein argonaute-2-like [Eriocheir sinensis]|uniref:protein argonaute-2-like n=1 Tax=Eriocheir sinensis TaxID=95602 RepID=UPI0021C70390|nr:protein argonaute-2-like [Eriocheir sinensis]